MCSSWRRDRQGRSPWHGNVVQEDLEVRDLKVLMNTKVTVMVTVVSVEVICFGISIFAFVSTLTKNHVV